MSQAYAWSQSDIPHTGADAPYQPRPTTVNKSNYQGRPKHPVSAGTHDDALLNMDTAGHPIESIAAKFQCSVPIAQRRLKMLLREAAQ